MGNDANSGRTWGTRLATINGAEDKPVVPGDVVYIAPGVYRETLTVDVSGAAGRLITYIGDVTGEHTDGVGGPVRITGSNNDQSETRANSITATEKDYRTFRGFHYDTNDDIIFLSNCDDWIIEDCALGVANEGIVIQSTSTNITVRRCAFHAQFVRSIWITHDATVSDAGHLFENLTIEHGDVRVDRVGGITFRNVTWVGVENALRIFNALAIGQTITVNNCIITACELGLRGTVLGEIVEDYNTFYENGTDRTNVAVGGNSVTYPALFALPILNAGYGLESGFRLPWWYGSLSRWSQIRQIAGTSEPDEDLFGIRRPYTHGGPVAALCSWGPVQWTDFRRDTLRSHDGSLSARVKEKSKTWMFVPGISAVSHTISAWAWRTAGYGGHRNPEMVIKQPGQADRRTVAGGAAGAWVQVSDTFTPAAVPPWLTVELWNQCAFTTTTTVSTTSTSTLSTTSTSTVTVSTLTTTTTTLPCDVWWDDIQVS